MPKKSSPSPLKYNIGTESLSNICARCSMQQSKIIKNKKEKYNRLKFKSTVYHCFILKFPLLRLKEPCNTSLCTRLLPTFRWVHVKCRNECGNCIEWMSCCFCQQQNKNLVFHILIGLRRRRCAMHSKLLLFLLRLLVFRQTLLCRWRCHAAANVAH